MASKGNPISFLDREFRMVLVGKTGVGKSATGNTIIGTGKVGSIFKSLMRAMSVTQNCKQHSFKRFGYDLQLVDVPGFCDTKRPHEDIKNEVMKCVAMSSPGIHAILFIIKIDRLGDNDKKTLDFFLQCFGEEAKKFVIFVFTGKDYLDREGSTIDQYLCDCPVKLKNFLFGTKLRHVAVNNEGTDKEKEAFTQNLIEMVKRMVDENGGQCYTNEMYAKCEADLREAEKKEKLEEKRQKEFEEKLKQEAVALDERRLQMKKDEEQLEQRLKALELRQKEDEERKREAERKVEQENMRIELERIRDLQRIEKENFELRKEDLRLEEIRKQMREKLEEGNMGFLRTAWQSAKNLVFSLW